MRLTAAEVSAIQKASRHIWGETVSIWVFGSRVDDSKRGGDIDLLVLASNEDERILFLKSEIDFLIELKGLIGDQKIDTVFATPQLLQQDPFLRTLESRIPLTGVHLVPLTPELISTFRKFHCDVGGGCFCAVWSSFDQNWQERCAKDAGFANFEHTAEAVRSGERPGFFLFKEGQPVAWTATGLKQQFPYLSTKYGSRLTIAEETRWSIGCLTVHPKMRGQGLLNVLIKCILQKARASGAKDIEAYPVVPGNAERAYRGSVQLFTRHGFQKVTSERLGDEEFTVMRLVLGS